MSRCRRNPARYLAASVIVSSLLAAASATAQTPTPTPSPPDAPATAEPAPAAPATEAPPPASADAPAPAATPDAIPPDPVPPGPPPPGPPPPSLIPDGEAPKGPVAPAFPPAIPSIDYGGRVRVALKFQNPERPQQMNDIGEQMDADMYMSGQVHRFFKWQVSFTLAFTGTAGASNSINIQPLDVMARFEPLPEFNIYMGRMLVVADRFAPSGPWGMDEFFFPGFFPLIPAPALPKSGPTGRDLGTNVWGAPFKGHAKYYLGVYNLNDPASNPLLTGRVQVSLLNGEPAFFHRTTYYGTKDLLSVGIGGQYQKAGSVQTVPAAVPPAPPVVPLTDDYKYATADVTFEKNIGTAGTLSVVGAYSKIDGDYQRWKDFWLGSVGYMLPKPVGIGKPRITVRYQGGKDAAPGAKPSHLVDAQLSYLVAAWFARASLGYRRGETWVAPTMMVPAATRPSNMIYLGMTVGDP
jgi:hypothetical protein